MVEIFEEGVSGSGSGGGDGDDGGGDGDAVDVSALVGIGFDKHAFLVLSAITRLVVGNAFIRTGKDPDAGESRWSGFCLDCIPGLLRPFSFL